MNKELNVADILVGVVGLGLMGSSIIVALALSGHKVVAVAPIEEDLVNAPEYIKAEIENFVDSGSLDIDKMEIWNRICITSDYSELKDCALVIECVAEQLEIKKSVYSKLTQHVGPDAIIASNTSALPISFLQPLVPNPERFLGMHWAEPAYLTRFMEITCGQRTSRENALWIYELAHCWNKEPTIVWKDIRGFITNRLMYALYREAFNLSESNIISFEDLDKCLKYDMGAWMTFMGILRRLDYMGIEDQGKVIPSIFLSLCNDEKLPEIMIQKMQKNARGTKNGNGIYSYMNGEAEAWEKAFARFNKEIYELAKYYPSNHIKPKI